MKYLHKTWRISKHSDIILYDSAFPISKNKLSSVSFTELENGFVTGKELDEDDGKILLGVEIVIKLVETDVEETVEGGFLVGLLLDAVDVILVVAVFDGFDSLLDWLNVLDMVLCGSIAFKT